MEDHLDSRRPGLNLFQVSIRARPIGRAMLHCPVPRPVSIRARPIGRAMHAKPLGTTTGFNPRPANWPGDARQTWFNPRPANWPGDAAWAIAGFNPRPANWPGDALSARCVLFQSAPGQLAGRCCRTFRSAFQSARPIGRAMQSLDRCQFQSAPGQLAGRCRECRWRIAPRSGFNPRPANWPGDARAA